MASPQVLYVTAGSPSLDRLPAVFARRDAALDVSVETDARNALETIDREEVAGVVSDQDLTDRSGLAFLEAVRRRTPELPFVLVVEGGDADIARGSLGAGATDYVYAPVDGDGFDRLAKRIETAITANAVEDERSAFGDEEILDIAPIGLFVLDEAGAIVWANDQYVAGFEEERDELLGMSFPELIDRGYYDGTSRSQYVDEVRKLLSSKHDHEKAKYEVRFRPRDGDERIYDVHTKLLPLEDGEFQGTVHAMRDVTRRERYQQELERQNERLEEFAGLISHDLRNPLNVAQGHLDLHAEHCESDALADVAWSLDRMEELIEDVLSLARNGESVGEFEPVNLPAVAVDAWAAVDTADATLEVREERSISADRSRLRALFENLFRNAVEHGGTDVAVTVGFVEDGDPSDRPSGDFFVEDDGPGLGDQGSDVLELGYTTNECGTGFGLNIVRQIAEAHGWLVSADDGVDGGARFEIRNVTIDRNPT